MSNKRYNSASQRNEKRASPRRRFTQIMAIVLSVLMCLGMFSYLIMAILGII